MSSREAGQANSQLKDVLSQTVTEFFLKLLFFVTTVGLYFFPIFILIFLSGKKKVSITLLFGQEQLPV